MDTTLHTKTHDVGRDAYSIDEAARRLGISRSLAYRMVREGKIPTVTLGRRRLVARAALDRVLAGDAA